MNPDDLYDYYKKNNYIDDHTHYDSYEEFKEYSKNIYSIQEPTGEQPIDLAEFARLKAEMEKLRKEFDKIKKAEAKARAEKAEEESEIKKIVEQNKQETDSDPLLSIQEMAESS